MNEPIWTMARRAERLEPSTIREFAPYECAFIAVEGDDDGPQVDATALLPRAVEAGMAFVPGAGFFPQGGRANTLRPSFVTAAPAQIDFGVKRLAGVLKNALAASAISRRGPP